MRIAACLFGIVIVLIPNAFLAQQGGSGAWKIVELKSPAGPSSGEPYLAVSNSALFMSWFEKNPKGEHLLKYSKWDGKAWISPVTIASGNHFFVNWADFPSILPLNNGSLAAHWLEKKSTGPYDYHVLVSLSRDQGKNWKPAVSPHKDTSPTEHGFATLFDRSKGNFSVVWLDGRNLKMDKNHNASGAMSLYYANFEKDAFQTEVILDSRVCDCCQTDGAMTQEGPIVVYRDRTEKEIRDISYVRQVGGKWTAPATIHADNWHIPGCPVNGPAVAASGNRVAVAWFTGAANKPAVQIALSSDNGKKFGKPIRLDQGNPSGRVDVAFLSDGSAMVCWLENVKEKGAEIRGRQIFPDGRMANYFVIADSSTARSSGFPKMATLGKETFIAWTHATDPAQVRIARLVPAP